MLEYHLATTPTWIGSKCSVWHQCKHPLHGDNNIARDYVIINRYSFRMFSDLASQIIHAKEAHYINRFFMRASAESYNPPLKSLHTYINGRITSYRPLRASTSCTSGCSILARMLHCELAEGIHIDHPQRALLSGIEVDARHSQVGDLAGAVGLISLKPASCTETPATTPL